MQSENIDAAGSQVAGNATQMVFGVFGEDTRVDPALAGHREVVFHVRTELEGTPRLTVFAESGEEVHASVSGGALRLHLPPGSYHAVAELGSAAAERDFEVGDEDSTRVGLELK